ncbi:DNA helicase [Ascochyta rabiei]|uniref:ATP-dependent DNA helicase n=1 Tax=Didymella rabiei TaxID=5454 RepID=A0A162Y8S9_DIDRA|nr:DNA helicase [Ascochyta rabiei]KZM19880.1 ATP binding [Ascochyta rabiei]UPX13910.1 DNA helicase [Ascochyta rabiei]
MDNEPPGSSQAFLKSFAQASGPPLGTQRAPFEILSSPEPEPKRRKTANEEGIKPAKSKSYDGSSRQETTKMLTESTDVGPKKIRFYAVAVGRNPGVYKDWSTVEALTRGFPGAKHKKFKTEQEALAYIDKYREHVEKLSGLIPSHQPGRVFELPSSTRSSGPRAHTASFSEYEPTSYETIPSEPLSLQQMRMLYPQMEQNLAEIDQNFVPLDDGPKLVPEQQQVVDLIVQGHNVFYTGSAGCGKSTILKAFVRQLEEKGKRVRIVAPTNLAALNVGGQTTWSFAGWTPDSMKLGIDKLMENSRGKESWKKFDETDVLVIDEISMIENLQFERLNMIMKASRGEKYSGGAFGGVQLVVTGDFYQLAPVKPFTHCMCGWELEKDNNNSPKEYKCENRDCREDVFYDIDMWAFRSHAWEKCNFKHVNLTQIHRQSDMMFKSILNRIRTDGKILKPHANVLLNHTSETEGAIMLFARRFDVDRVNSENIAKIQSAARIYKCVDDFYWPGNHRSDKTLEKNTYRLPDGSLSTLKEHRFDTQVQLKQDQRVVLQANLDPAVGLVNGAQGKIVEFKPYDEKDLPKVPVKKNEGGDLRGDHAAYREAQIKAFGDVNGHQPWPVVQFTNGVTRTIFADCTVNLLGNYEPYCKLSRTQIPLTAGYAITVHKSQGMTLDRVTVDLARAFEPSQIYVALSRARSLKGLTVTALPRFDLGGANAQVKEFMEKHVIKKKPEP